jgi:cation-transporting ATPase 13A1
MSKIAVAQKKERKARKKQKDSTKKDKDAKSKKAARSRAIQRSLQQLAETEEELNHVSLGDASVASPFTSRTVSIKCCKDVLQQGRATAATMIQIYKILGINCLVNALVLTKLHLHGVKQGDRQLTAVGVVVAALFLFVTKGRPLSTLSLERPPSSVLCIQALLSIAVQFGIHFFILMATTHMCMAYVDPYDPSIIPDGAFNPNILNTCTFLLTVTATLTTFVVNYAGRPFMEDLVDNKLLWRSFQVSFGMLFVCALEIFTPLNQLLQLSPLPTLSMEESARLLENGAGENGDLLFFTLSKIVDIVGFRFTLCVLMVIDSALAFVVEKYFIKLL